MRKFFYCFGIGAALLTTTFVACVGYAIYTGAEITKEGSAYSKAAVVAITTNWSADALATRAAPELMRSTDASQLRLAFDRLETLGPMVKAPECSGGATVHYDISQATTIRTLYACNATYQKRVAIVRIWLTKADGRWMIYGFRVKSPTFAAPTVRKV